jgi:hypothetical protein
LHFWVKNRSFWGLWGDIPEGVLPLSLEPSNAKVQYLGVKRPLESVIWLFWGIFRGDFPLFERHLDLPTVVCNTLTLSSSKLVLRTEKSEK